MKISRVLAIAKRQIILNLRFKWSYLLGTFIFPLKSLVGFFIVYSGFFYSGATNIGGITKETYVVFLLLGMIFMTIFNKGLGVISGAFTQEKFWQTIQGVLTSPAKKIEIVLGYGIGGLVNMLPLSVLSLAICYAIMPISIINFICIIILLALMYLTILGIGFIRAALQLSNENISAFLTPFFLGWMFISCFYYPITSLPKFTHPLVKLNPIYHANWVIKSLWMHGSFELKSFFYLALLSLISLSVGIYIFNKVWKKMGIQGY
jgi:ABC-type polysaccharide/polyol phosphate export permease